MMTQKLEKTNPVGISGISELSSISEPKQQPSMMTQTSSSITAAKSPAKIEKPNNIQEDPSPDANMNKKSHEIKQNNNVDLDAFKNIIGNRTPNYFMMQTSTLDNIPLPKKKMNYSPSAIEDSNFAPFSQTGK